MPYIITSRYWSVQFLCFSLAKVTFVNTAGLVRGFNWSPLVGKPRMTSVSFVKTRNRASRLRNHTRFTDFVTIRVVHLPERIETGLITASERAIYMERNETNLSTASDQTVRAVHSCSSWFPVFCFVFVVFFLLLLLLLLLLLFLFVFLALNAYIIHD